MLNFLLEYGTTIFHILNLIAWYLIYRKGRLLNINRLTVKYFIFFFLIVIVWNFFMIVSNRSPVVYIIFWAIFSIYELYFVLTVIFYLAKARKNYAELYIIIISILAIPIILSALLSYTNRSYSPINTSDFYNIILLMIGSILVLKSIINYPSFMDNIESFFIFSGFVLYFGLHILASNALSIDILKNFNFAKYATFISLIYWFGSVFFIWKIRSKHSS
ncbi:MAG: hypothetical protein JXB60_00795 [Candidatus Cloacimonetes bacterium]|nr:hypothetical protein [Candidatus Cloacimonadota bacterium]